MWLEAGTSQVSLATEPGLQPPLKVAWMGKDAERTFNVLTETSRKVAQTRFFFFFFFASGISQEKVQREVPGCSYILTVFKKRPLLTGWELTFKVIVLILYIFLEQLMCFAPRNAHKC